MDIFWRGKILNNSDDLQSAFRHCSINEKVVHLDITTRDRQPGDQRILPNQQEIFQIPQKEAPKFDSNFAIFQRPAHDANRSLNFAPPETSAFEDDVIFEPKQPKFKPVIQQEEDFVFDNMPLVVAPSG